VQANWHFEPSWLATWVERGWVDAGALFTVSTRWDAIHLDTYDRRRLTFGLNFRPNPNDTVYKLDWQFNDDSGSEAGTNNDNALILSVATYF
jgi:hypothetical protein